MKVLLAGYSKTGTKTMYAALRILGYNVYDFNENFWYLGDDWMRIARCGGTIDDLRRMYKDVDAAVDVPIFTYWEEFVQAFPDVKIIFTNRDEDSWYKSVCKQAEELENNFVLQLIFTITPTGRRYFEFFKTLIPIALGGPLTRTFKRLPRNEMELKRKFRLHNFYFKQRAPKQNLLELDLKDGWEPLCKFLEKDIPNQPFPHENVRGNILEKWMKEHPLMQRMKKELFMSIGVIALVIGFGGYKLYKHVPWRKFGKVVKEFTLHSI